MTPHLTRLPSGPPGPPPPLQVILHTADVSNCPGPPPPLQVILHAADVSNCPGPLPPLQVILHAADVSNSVRPFSVNEVMSRRVHNEFQAQANEEITQGLPVTFAVNRSDLRACAQVGGAGVVQAAVSTAACYNMHLTRPSHAFPLPLSPPPPPRPILLPLPCQVSCS